MERVIVGYDDSPPARGALAWAIHHARRSGAELVHQLRLSSSFESELNAAQVNTNPIRRELQRRLRGQWTESGPGRRRPLPAQFETGRPAEALLDAARRDDASLIVIGVTPRGTLGELVFSSVTHRLSHRAVRPVVRCRQAGNLAWVTDQEPCDGTREWWRARGCPLVRRQDRDRPASIECASRRPRSTRHPATTSPRETSPPSSGSVER
jgi:nucleotide-binding universal stress UspA family protein